MIVVSKPMIAEPPKGALIACEIFTGDFRNALPVWEQRTYEATRTRKGWLVDFGCGESEPFQTWSDVMRWLESMRVRNLEMIAW